MTQGGFSGSSSTQSKSLVKWSSVLNKFNMFGCASATINHISLSNLQCVCLCSDDHTISGELKAPSSNSRDLEESLSLISVLKEKNISMEGELKEMQERYSEISLKFAEVEGERQQLVMTLRNLKNAKKSS